MTQSEACGPGEDVGADGGDAVEKGRGVGVLEPGGGGGRVFDEVGDGVGEEVDGGDEEVAAAHGGVEHFEVERGCGGVERAEVGDTAGLGACVALECGGFGLEGGFALFEQGCEGALDDEVDERLGGVEAAAVLAGVAVGADDDFAFKVCGRVRARAGARRWSRAAGRSCRGS